MYSISTLARRHGLSRSTLLYYDRLGLLKASAHSENGYRLYSDADARRLERICLYRRTGLSLQQIAHLIDDSNSNYMSTLEAHLQQLNQAISELRQQQRYTLALLKEHANFCDGHRVESRALSKQQWVHILAASGLDEAARDRWHAQFERLSPQAHQDFLEQLGIDGEEIAAIRAYSRRPETPKI